MGIERYNVYWTKQILRVLKLIIANKKLMNAN